jgi:hypothetical protein
MQMIQDVLDGLLTNSLLEQHCWCVIVRPCVSYNVHSPVNFVIQGINRPDP